MEKERIKAAAAKAGITFNTISNEMGMTRQNFTQRATRESWTEKEYKQIADAIGAKYVSYFLFEDGTKI